MWRKWCFVYVLFFVLNTNLRFRSTCRHGVVIKYFICENLNRHLFWLRICMIIQALMWRKLLFIIFINRFTGSKYKLYVALFTNVMKKVEVKNKNKKPKQNLNYDNILKLKKSKCKEDEAKLEKKIQNIYIRSLLCVFYIGSGTVFILWKGNHSLSLAGLCWLVAGSHFVGEKLSFSWDCCPCDPTPDEAVKYGLVDGWLPSIKTLFIYPQNIFA